MTRQDMVALAPAQEAEYRRTRNIRSCLETAGQWRRQAENLRAHAELPHLTEQGRDMLLREATSADASAAYL
jgi:glycine/D-amino acid oxidase-like deaminating enzyme